MPTVPYASPNYQQATTSDQYISIPKSLYESLLANSSSNQTDSQIKDARERIIKLETEVTHLKETIKELKEGRRFTISIVISFLSLMIAAYVAYMTHPIFRDAKTISAPQQSVVPDTQR